MASNQLRNTALGLFMASAALFCQKDDSSSAPRLFEPDLVAENELTIQTVQEAFPETDLPEIEEAPDRAKVPFHTELLKNAYRDCYPNKYASIVTDAITGEILYAHNEHVPRHPASLTKLMTMFLTFEEIERGNLKLDDPLVVSKMDARKNLALLMVGPNEKFTVEDALKGIVTRSAADATDNLAENIGNGKNRYIEKTGKTVLDRKGNMERFIGRMNERAESLGMCNTTFTNPSGAPDADQLTTAYDMAVLMRSIMQYFPEQCAVFKTKSFSFHGINIRNHALSNDADFAKTGFTIASSFNHALSLPNDESRLIVGVFGGKSSFSRRNHVDDLIKVGKEIREKNPVIIPQTAYNCESEFPSFPSKLDINKFYDIEPIKEIKRPPLWLNEISPFAQKNQPGYVAPIFIESHIKKPKNNR